MSAVIGTAPPQPLEHSALIWASAHDMMALDLIEADRELVKKLSVELQP